MWRTFVILLAMVSLASLCDRPAKPRHEMTGSSVLSSDAHAAESAFALEPRQRNASLPDLVERWEERDDEEWSPLEPFPKPATDLYPLHPTLALRPFSSDCRFAIATGPGERLRC